MDPSNEEMLRQAVERNATAILALPATGILRHHKTRFLAEGLGSINNGADGIWIESPPGHMPLLDKLMAHGAPVSIAFRSGLASVVFSAPIRRRLEEFRLNQATPQSTTRALLLPFPQEFKPLQRRAVYRAGVAGQTPIHVRLWRIPDHAVLRDRPPAAAEFHARPADLSVDGMGFICQPKQGKLPPLAIGQRLRVQLRFAGHEVLVEARLLHQRMLGEEVLAGGITFKKLEKDFEGRQSLSKLTAMVGTLQRQELLRRGEPGVNEIWPLESLPKIAS
jgi:hypothetical protein